MEKANDTRPLIATKTFQLEGRRVAKGLQMRAAWGGLLGGISALLGIVLMKANPQDLALGPTLIWAGAVVAGLCLCAPAFAGLMSVLLPRPSQRVEFYSHELDVILIEGASRSIPYIAVESMWEEGQSLCIKVGGETLEIPYLAFQTRWEMERAQGLIKAMRPDDSLKSLAA